VLLSTGDPGDEVPGLVLVLGVAGNTPTAEAVVDHGEAVGAYRQRNDDIVVFAQHAVEQRNGVRVLNQEGSGTGHKTVNLLVEAPVHAVGRCAFLVEADVGFHTLLVIRV